MALASLVRTRGLESACAWAKRLVGRVEGNPGGQVNAQGRLRQTNAAMQAAILGTPMPTNFMDKRQINVNLDNLKNLTPPDLQGISNIPPPIKPNVLLDPNRNNQTPLTSEEIVELMGGF